jgi:Tol biopolymer transport system component
MRAVHALGLCLGLSLGLLLAGCGSSSDDDGGGPQPDDPIEIDPPMARITVPLGRTVDQAYRVISVSERGDRTDITADCTISVDAAFGTVNASTVTVVSHGGETQVRAGCGTRSASSQLIVNLTGQIIIGPNTPPNAPDLFAGATTGADTARQPNIEYPFDHAVSPVNMPGLEVQWTAAGNDLFHVALASDYAAIDVYTTSLEAPLGEPDWASIAYTAAGGDLGITVEGLAQSAPTTKYAGAPIALTMSRDAIDRTAIYYWASSQGQIMNQTFGSTAMATQVRGGCTSCHSLSRNGTRLGYSRCVAGDCGQLYAGFMKYDRTSMTWTEPVNADNEAIHGSYTTFAPVGNPFPTDDQSLAIVSMVNGTLQLYDPDTGAVVPSNLSDYSTHGPGAPRSGLMADWSSDGTSVVYASAPGVNQWIDLNGGAIAKMTYQYANGSHTFGEPQFLVPGPITLPSGSYTNFFFPSFSGDGALVVFNGARAAWRNFSDARTAGQRLFLTDAAGAWTTDLTQMNGPADVDITWPHWAPGASSDYYWVVFSSERDYGHKLTTSNTSSSCVANGVKQCKQIWVGAISKATLQAAPGTDPSAPPLWLPGQNYQTNNISPYWTAEIPIN